MWWAVLGCMVVAFGSIAFVKDHKSRTWNLTFIGIAMSGCLGALYVLAVYGGLPLY